MYRLLSEHERVRTERVGDNPRNFMTERLDEDEMLSAQLSKADKEWVRQIERRQDILHMNGHDLFIDGDYVIMLVSQWQQLKENMVSSK